MENNQPHGVSRRSVAKGAAWAVPAVVALGAAPKAAASEPCVPTFSFGGASCKCPGQSTDQSWGYYLQICGSLANGCQTPADGFIYVFAVENNAKKPLTGPSFPIKVPVNGCNSSYLLFNSQSSASSIRFQYSYTSAGDNLTWSAYIDAPPDCATDPNVPKSCLAPGQAPSVAKASSTSTSSTTAPSSAAPSTSSAPTSSAPPAAAPSSTPALTSTPSAG